MLTRVTARQSWRNLVTLAQDRLEAGVWSWLRSNVSVRFTRFLGVAAVALATSLIVLGVCDGILHLTSVPAALISQICGALVSYVLSRWAWERKGKPNVLRETVPFWVVFGVATVISTLATKLGYRVAASMHLHGFKHVLVVEGVYLVANVVTFLMRFVIFHYVLFADRTTEAEDAATGLDIPAAGTHSHRPAEAPEPAAADVTVMASSVM
jgi:putative flippase GtrA